MAPPLNRLTVHQSLHEGNLTIAVIQKPGGRGGTAGLAAGLNETLARLLLQPALEQLMMYGETTQSPRLRLQCSEFALPTPV